MLSWGKRKVWKEPWLWFFMPHQVREEIDPYYPGSGRLVDYHFWSPRGLLLASSSFLYLFLALTLCLPQSISSLTILHLVKYFLSRLVFLFAWIWSGWKHWFSQRFGIFQTDLTCKNITKNGFGWYTRILPNFQRFRSIKVDTGSLKPTKGAKITLNPINIIK